MGLPKPFNISVLRNTIQGSFSVRILFSIEKLEGLVTTGRIEGKRQGKTARRDVGWINSVAKRRMSDIFSRSDEVAWNMVIAYAKEQGII